MIKKILASCLALTLFSCKSFKEVVIKDKQQWKWEGISLTEEALKQEEFPKNATMAIFVPTANLNQAMQGLIGTDIRSTRDYKALKLNVKTTSWGLKVDSIKTIPENGVFFVKLQSSVVNPKNKKKLLVDLEAQLNISGIKRNDTTISLMYHLLPVSIYPHFKVSALNAKSTFGARVLADLTTLWAEQKNNLSFEVEIGDQLEVSLSKFFPVDTTSRFNINKDHRDWYVDINHKLSDFKLRKYLHLNPPAIIKSGIWLSFKLKDEPMKRDILPAKTPPLLGAKLAVLNKESDERVDKWVVDHQLNKSHTYLWINKKIISDLFNDINELTAQEKTINIKSVKKEGFLYRKDWNHGLLGKGEVYARFEQDDAVSGKVSINSLQNSWKAGHGLLLALDVIANLHSDVHLHVDPNIGGGVGTKIGLGSETKENIKGLVKFSLDSINGQVAILAKADIGCTNIDLKTLTDPKFKFDYGWTKIPSFGITMPINLASKPVAPFMVLHSVPHSQRLEKKRYIVSDKDTVITKEDTISLVTLPYTYLSYTTTPQSIVVEEEGMEVNFKTDISYTNDSLKVEGYKNAETALHAAVKNLKPELLNCKKGDLEVHMGPLNLGSNNDIIRFLGDSWKDIINGPGDNNEIVRVIDAVGDLINDKTPLDDVTYNFLNEVTVFSQRNLGENNEITKALRNAKNEVEKFRKTPGKAIGDIPGNVVREVKSGLKKLKKRLCSFC